MKKILSLLLVALMLVGMLPMNAIHAKAAAGEYELVTDVSQLSVGAKVIIAAKDYNYAMSTTQNNNNRGKTDITKGDGVLSAPSSVVQVLTLEEGTTAGTYAFNTGSGYLYAASSSSNYLRTETTLSANSSWSIVIAADGTATVTAKGTNTRNVMQYNQSNSLFACYSSASQKAVVLYVLNEGSGDCDHANATTTTVDATCTEDGYTTVTCDCGYTSTTAIAALGHTWGDWSEITAATCTAAGSQERICSVCSEKESGEISATGHSYVDGACSACGEEAPAAVASKISTAEEFVSGDYVMIVGDGKAMNVYEDGWVTVTDAVISGNDVVEIEGGIWTLTVTGSTVTIVDGNGVSIASKGSATNGITSGECSWTYTLNDDGTFTFKNVDHVVTLASNVSSSYKFRAYKDATVSNNPTGYLAEFDLYKVIDDEGDEPVCEHANTTTNTVAATCTAVGSETVVCDDCGETVSITELPMIDHSFGEDNKCTVCGFEFEGEPDTTDPTEPEAVKITFELGDDGDASHNDGSEKSEYTETVSGYTLSITGGTKMYTGARDAKGNGCIKLGTSKLVGGFTFTVPTDVTQVIIRAAKYKANTTKFSVNGTEYTLNNASNDGAYDEITVDTSSSKTVTVTTVATNYRAMVNSITFVCGKADHTCQWDEGTVTTPATCTTDGERTYSCTVDGCTITKTEKIEATGHSFTYTETAITCANCDYSVAYTLSTIAEAKAYTDASLVYYVKGIVTYVSGNKIYIEDSTGGLLVMFNGEDGAGIALGDEILVWDCLTTYNGLIETTYTTAQEYLKVSSGNALPSQTVTLADLLADTTNEYLAERVVIENVTIGTINTSGNTALTDADGNTINIYKVSGLSEDINENDTVTVTAIVSTYNGYQLLINPGTAATDVVETAGGEETVVTTVTIAEAKAGTAGEYYQVEGVVTYISGRNVYIQDATGGIVVYLTANAATTQVGDKVKAYGALKLYNGLIELDAVDEGNEKFYEILSSGNTVDAQEVTIEGLLADTSNEYLAEKITLNGVYVSYNSYSSQYGNVTYTLTDGNGNTIEIYRVPVASEEECVAGGSIVNVEAIVSAYDGYQLVTDNAKITVTGTCAHETTELVNVKDATLTAGGYTGDTMCTVCGNYTERGEDTAALTDVDSWGLTLGGDILVNFKIALAESIKDSAQITVAVADKTYTYAAKDYYADGYVYVSASVAAAQMTDEITVTVINGEDQAVKPGYTIKSYAETVLNGDYDNATKALVTAMLHYGAAAQTFFNYKTDAMANADLDPAEDVTIPADAAGEIEVVGSAEGITFYGASLVFENKIAVRFYFTGSAEDIKGAVEKDGKFYIEVAGINPQDLGDAATVKIGELYVSYSPMNYIVRMAEKNENEDLVELVKALYSYHLAAQAYATANAV